MDHVRTVSSMNMNPIAAEARITNVIGAVGHVRIVGFGSSNTARNRHPMGRYLWLDWLDVALETDQGRKHHIINSGISGDSTIELLGRFARDVALFQPHLVLITVGGNDSNPASQMSSETYEANLRQLTQSTRNLPNCLPVLQTYYAPVREELAEGYGERFFAFMGAVRTVATEMTVPLIDNLSRWERLRLDAPGTHRSLMHDPLHLNALGHAVWGLDVIRTFGATLSPDYDSLEVIREARVIQKRLDTLGCSDNGAGASL